MDRSKHHGVGIFTLIKLSKEFGFIRYSEDACIFTRSKWERKDILLILYVDDILLIGSDVSFLDTVKISLKNDFDERLRLNNILGIMIYGDRLRRQILLS